MRDPRSLGIAVRRLVLRQRGVSRTIDACDARLTDGYHSYEPVDAIRWTNGNASVPDELLAGLSSPGTLTICLGGATRYVDPGIMRTAA